MGNRQETVHQRIRVQDSSFQQLVRLYQQIKTLLQPLSPQCHNINNNRPPTATSNNLPNSTMLLHE
jgi:hypothetical protein